jgi:hypothetical protein
MSTYDPVREVCALFGGNTVKESHQVANERLLLTGCFGLFAERPYLIQAERSLFGFA